jgi:hypothetical protein
VARLTFVEARVEISSSGGKWARAAEGSPLRTGERLRTGPDGLARVEFPWMSIVVSPGSLVSTPLDQVLSILFEEGRLAVVSEEEIIKVVTGEAKVRGRGHAIVRRQPGSTAVTALSGTVRVEGLGAAVMLRQGEGTVVTLGQDQGTVVERGAAPRPPFSLPPPPEVVSPGSDPHYVKLGEPVQLSWSPAQTPAHVQILGIASDEVLIERDAPRSPASIEVPWPGTFRWRVSGRDPRGPESRPSSEGLFCVVDR